MIKRNKTGHLNPHVHRVPGQRGDSQGYFIRGGVGGWVGGMFSMESLGKLIVMNFPCRPSGAQMKSTPLSVRSISLLH